MKIIINQPRTSYFVGGAEMISIDHAINFYNLGNDVSFYTINPQSINLSYSTQYINFYEKYKDKINFIEFNQSSKISEIYEISPGENRIRWNVESIYYNRELYRYLSSQEDVYDVLFSYYNLDGCFIPQEKIKRNILYLCGIPREQNDFQGSFLYCYDKVIAISDEVKHSWEKYSKSNVPVVTTGVDCKKFCPSKNHDSDIIRLLYVGRLIERKNVKCIIEVFEQLRNNYKINLTIVGDGPNREELEKLSAAVTFTGVVSDTEKYYRNADIFISPSSYGEGLQGTILEAMSSGLTVIATDTGINNEILSSGRGFTVSPNTESVKNAIIKAIESDRTVIANNSREFILRNYSWTYKVKELLEEIR